MVTAETALVLTALATMTIGLMWVVSVVALQSRCVDAARDTARAVARGETWAVSRAEGRRSAPDGATIAIRVRDTVALVDVGVDARPPLPVLARLPAVRVSAQAAVALEPGVS